jgi:hypothetical protein
MQHVYELEALGRADVQRDGLVLSGARLVKPDGAMVQLELDAAAARVANPECHLYHEAHSAVWRAGGYEGGLVYRCSMAAEGALGYFHGCKILVGEVSHRPKGPILVRDAYLLDLLEGPELGPLMTAEEALRRFFGAGAA